MRARALGVDVLAQGDQLATVDCAAAELTRYAKKIIAIQTKDVAPNGTTAEDGWTATGDGIINWAALAPLFHQTAATHLVTEHDNPADWRRFAKRSVDHLRGLGI